LHETPSSYGNNLVEESLDWLEELLDKHSEPRREAGTASPIRLI
jgi:hypothetical protein